MRALGRARGSRLAALAARAHSEAARSWEQEPGSATLRSAVRSSSSRRPSQPSRTRASSAAQSTASRDRLRQPPRLSARSEGEETSARRSASQPERSSDVSRADVSGTVARSPRSGQRAITRVCRRGAALAASRSASAVRQVQPERFRLRSPRECARTSLTAASVTFRQSASERALRSGEEATMGRSIPSESDSPDRSSDSSAGQLSSVTGTRTPQSCSSRSLACPSCSMRMPPTVLSVGARVQRERLRCSSRAHRLSSMRSIAFVSERPLRSSSRRNARLPVMSCTIRSRQGARTPARHSALMRGHARKTRPGVRTSSATLRSESASSAG